MARICSELDTSDRELKASREGLKRRNCRRDLNDLTIHEGNPQGVLQSERECRHSNLPHWGTSLSIPPLP